MQLNSCSHFHKLLTCNFFFVMSSYKGQLCGLCGDYDGDAKDDFRKPDGSLTNSANDFGHSWNTDPESVLQGYKHSYIFFNYCKFLVAILRFSLTYSTAI